MGNGAETLITVINYMKKFSIQAKTHLLSLQTLLLLEYMMNVVFVINMNLKQIGIARLMIGMLILLIILLNQLILHAQPQMLNGQIRLPAKIIERQWLLCVATHSQYPEIRKVL